MTLPAMIPLVLASAGAVQYSDAAQPEPRVLVWLDADARYERGDHARTFVRAAYDGYLVVLHADADNRVRVLFPLDPVHDNFVRGAENLELRGRGDRDAFLIEERAGNGIVLAAWSPDPFRFQPFMRGDHWDYRVLTPEQRDDPEAALLDVVHAMADGRPFDYDAVPYIVGRASDGGGSRLFVSVGARHGGCYNCVGVRYRDPGFNVSFGFGYDPWFRFSVSSGRGWYDPYSWHPWYDPYWYDPFYHPVWYRRVLYRPIVVVAPWYRPIIRHRWAYDPYHWVRGPRFVHGGVGIRARYGHGCRGWCDDRPRTRFAFGEPGWATGEVYERYAVGRINRQVSPDGYGWGRGQAGAGVGAGVGGQPDRRAQPRQAQQIVTTVNNRRPDGLNDAVQRGSNGRVTVIEPGNPRQTDRAARVIQAPDNDPRQGRIGTSSSAQARVREDAQRTEPLRPNTARSRALSDIQREQQPPQQRRAVSRGSGEATSTTNPRVRVLPDINRQSPPGRATNQAQRRSETATAPQTRSPTERSSISSRIRDRQEPPGPPASRRATTRQQTTTRPAPTTRSTQDTRRDATTITRQPSQRSSAGRTSGTVGRSSGSVNRSSGTAVPRTSSGRASTERSSVSRSSPPRTSRSSDIRSSAGRAATTRSTPPSASRSSTGRSISTSRSVPSRSSPPSASRSTSRSAPPAARSAPSRTSSRASASSRSSGTSRASSSTRSGSSRGTARARAGGGVGRGN